NLCRQSHFAGIGENPADILDLAMISSRTTVEVNPVPVGTDDDAVEHVIKSRAAAGIEVCSGKHGPDACAIALRHPFHDFRIGAVSYREISSEINGHVRPDGHALCAIRNAVLSGAVELRACGGYVG